ncbi:MAG: ArnT family glycosyltransferase [Acidimicrobiales bacterium]
MPESSGSEAADQPTQASDATDHRARDGRLVGAALTVVGVALAAIGITVPYNYDESVTVGAFVKAPAWTDAVTRQIVYNNHPLVSLIDHVVHRVFGTTWEPALRALPLLAFVAAGVLLGIAVTRWWGPLAGGVAGLLLLTNPMMLIDGRAVRGYSILVLAALASSLVLIHVTRIERPTPAIITGYIVIGAVGTSAHLYMVLVLGLQFVACLAVPRLRADRFARWPVVATVAGSALQLPALQSFRSNDRGRSLRASFPIDLARILVGQQWVAALVGLALLAYGARRWLRVPPLGLLAGVVGLEVLAVWLIAPLDLFPRFFIWLAPAVVCGIVYGADQLRAVLGRWSALAWVACAAIVVAQLAVTVPDLDRAVLENRATGGILTAAAARGAVVCVLPTSREALMGYIEPPTAETPGQMAHCDVLASLVPERDSRFLPIADAAYPNRLVLDDAETPATLFTTADVECLVDHPPPGCWAG